ncbi:MULTISPECIES: SRPBCC family protein [unclassified Mycobacterium]|uniref:SRPBCC family protein n=1 Tax=unclassified Mycobacterium TaxID=2642494 RepID=UPI0006DC4516|nr:MULTISPECIES: SRPBCC family protein [unclassified Mycobacterium]OBG67494.1 polyketide cyclase [Mycobacterium sp. E3339]OBH83235.1 polyketide cyclase [Mycobacterium sp. E2989]
MSDMEAERIVSATRVIAANAARIFELIADPARQPSWDGNDNLASSAPGQRVRGVGDVFKTTLTNGAVRENHVVEFVEGSKIAWRPAEPRKEPPGHLWRWELSPVNAELTTVTHTYDWTALTDATRMERARATTPDMLRESIDRLAVVAQTPDAGGQA